MSQTNIQYKDEGYTSPDFLANLFKKPLYSPISLSSIHSLSDEGASSNYKENCSSPLLDTTNTSLKAINQNRVYRSLSIIDDDRIQSKKYKIFFKTLLHGRLSENELDTIWKQLEASISNPFEFDKLIEQIKAKRQSEIQQEMQQKPQKAVKTGQSLPLKEQTRSKSFEKPIKLQEIIFRDLTPTKIAYFKEIPQNKPKGVFSKLNSQQKNLIANQMSSIKNIITKNERKIRQKPL